MVKLWFPEAMTAPFLCCMLCPAGCYRRFSASSLARSEPEENCHQTISNHKSDIMLPQVKRIAFSPDGSILASAHSANIVALWNRCDARQSFVSFSRFVDVFSQ
jgi:WD40 repeat protein